MVNVGENIKVVGEVGDIKVIIAPCSWARSSGFQTCIKPQCQYYVYGEVEEGKTPYIIGWCNDLNIVIPRAESWVRMLEKKERAKERQFKFPEKQDKKKKTNAPGYL